MLAPPALVGAAPNEAVSSVSGDRYFPQTGYWIADDTIWDYFIKRGGVRTFGYPASRKFRSGEATSNSSSGESSKSGRMAARDSSIFSTGAY
jgi:hypothetical protein